MPVGLEKISEAEKLLTKQGAQCVDLYLKSAIEGVVIKWAYLVNGVVTQESSLSFDNGKNSTPGVELEFWSTRFTNLRYIYQQLRENRVKKMSKILEKTGSAYYPCFQTLYRSVVMSLEEAKEISLYLTPLGKNFKQCEETEFSESKSLMGVIIHCLGLAWSKSSHYRNSSKLIIMLRQISNLLIQEAQRYLDPTSIFQTDMEEALQRVQISRQVLEEFKIQFSLKKQQPGMKPDAPPWLFNSNAIFSRLDRFFKRLADIDWLFNTVLEFSKLEKIEIGGILGRSLTTRIVIISREFQQLFVFFTSRASDVLEPDDQSFALDCIKFQQSIADLDNKLAAILCQGFDDCGNVESVFKLINIAGSILDRPVIRQQFTNRSSRILTLLNTELSIVEVLLNRGNKGAFNHLPPFSAALTFTNMLKLRTRSLLLGFQSLEHP